MFGYDDDPPPYQSLYGEDNVSAPTQVQSPEPQAAPSSNLALPPPAQQPTEQSIQQASTRRDNTYVRKRGKSSMALILHPLLLLARRHQSWIGIMHVKCDNVPRLLRKGFCWDSSNVIDPECYYKSDVRDPKRHNPEIDLSDWDKEWTEARYFIMKDTEYEPPLWVAKLDVYADTRELLENVGLQGLGVNNLFNMRAYGNSGAELYHFSHTHISSSDENVYVGRRQNWWPWQCKDDVTAIHSKIGPKDFFLVGKGRS